MAKQVKQTGVGAPAKETNTSEHPLADNEGIFFCAIPTVQTRTAQDQANTKGMTHDEYSR